MDKDYLGISDVDLGTLKSAFITPSRDNVLYTGVLDNREVAELMSNISGLSREQKIALVKEKLNLIYTGAYSTESEVNKQEAIIVLLLKSIPFEKDEADVYWKSKSEAGVHDSTSKKVLIEIAAIHPLIDGKPGKEFSEHLEQAIELYHMEVKKGNTPIMYIPGSLHYVINKETGSAEVDSQPLSEAGKEFLIDHGIPEGAIRANVVNLDIKGEDGVYNSGDECYVATQIAKAEGCRRIISVVSPVQLYRKALFYQEFGYTPELYATGTEKTNHNYIGELFWSLYITYMNDQDWQTGFLSYLTRKERDIEYVQRAKEYLPLVDEIIKNGPGIPQDVFDKKKEWLAKYGIAQENMNKANENKKDILVDLVRSDDNSNLEINRLRNIISQYPDTKVTILYSAMSDVSDIEELLVTMPDANVELIATEDATTKKVAELFSNGEYRKLFGLYPSSICMKKAVSFIENGVIPIVSTVPDKNPDYVQNISELFGHVLEHGEVEKKEAGDIEL